MKMRTVLEGIGASLLLFPYYVPFFHPQNHPIYHHGLPITNLIGGLLVDLLCAAILVIGLLVAIQYLRPPVQRIVEAMFAGLMLWSAVSLAFHVLIDLLFRITYWGHIWERSVVVILASSAAIAYFLPRPTKPAVGAIRLMLAGLAFSALWIVPQLIHLALLRPPAQHAAFAFEAAGSHDSSKQRIVWILFDELSYDQTFDHPALGIELPNFDRLRAGSVSFSKLKPIGYTTDRIIPSLFLGVRIDKFRSTNEGQLSYWDEAQRNWLAYDPNATLFGLARRSGWKSAVDGWYNPYCGILAPTLDFCYRDPGIVLVPIEEYGASEDLSPLANAVAVPNEIQAALTGRTKNTAAEHMRAYLNIMAHTQAIIDDSRLRFAFLHIPAPHPPGIYDRRSHSLRPGGNYLDNLVLADDTLGVLMREIDASPSASQTTVIVSSDHSWRIPMWRPAADWSAEEERASAGKFDDRPVLLVHFPDRKTGEEIHAGLSEMLEHDIIAGMLRGQINNQEDLDAFLSPRLH